MRKSDIGIDNVARGLQAVRAVYDDVALTMKFIRALIVAQAVAGKSHSGVGSSVNITDQRNRAGALIYDRSAARRDQRPAVATEERNLRTEKCPDRRSFYPAALARTSQQHVLLGIPSLLHHAQWLFRSSALSDV